jgi:lipopolysaccharide biosynthesis protein
MPESSIRNNFFAGTMFWFRPLALEGVAAGRFSASDFEPEPLPQEGALPHGFERIFNLLAESAGFAILDSRDV